MALPAINKKKTVNDLIKDYETSKNSTSKIVPKSTTKTTAKSAPTAPTSSYAQSFISKNSVKEPITHESPYLNVNANTLVNGGMVKVPTTTLSGSGGTVTAPITNTESVADILRANYPTLSGGGAGGSSSSSYVDPSGMIDISNMLKAYEDAAAANKAVAEQSYNTRRNDLLTSLKRYQEQNAQDVAAQQKTYLSNQALVESAIAEADRQNRISASARGLGGSGLQQLAQLQTLLSQGQTISDMATENQETVNNLRKVLANYDEDTQTALADLEKTRENTIRGIESDLGTNKASLEYQAREKAADRVHAQQMAEAATAAQIAMQNAQFEAKAREDERALNSQLATLAKNYENEMSAIDSMSSSALKDAYGTKKASEAKKSLYDTYYSGLGDILNAYSVGGTSLAQSQYDTLSNLYNKYNTNSTNSSSSSNTKTILGIPVRTLSSSESTTYNDLYNKYLKQTNNASKAKQLANEEFARIS